MRVLIRRGPGMNPGDFAITPNGSVVQVLGPEPAVLVIYDDDSMAVLPEADLEPYTPEPS